MAEERDLTHDSIETQDRMEQDPGGARAAMRVGDVPYPDTETDYWRGIYSSEPYFQGGRRFEDYAPAYEFGWAGYSAYGTDVDIADRLMASDWEQRKGISSLSWDEARPASRAAWRRAENARSFISNGSASREQVVETLQDLLEMARDGELGSREAAEHARTAGISALFKGRAMTFATAAGEIRQQLQRLGATIEEPGGTLTGAAHRVVTHIRGLFGGASDETMLNEAERSEDATLARYRKALKQDLPHDIHALVQLQFEEAQRNHDLIRQLRNQARAETQAKTDDDA